MSSALSTQARRLAGLLAEPGIVTRASPFGCRRLALFRSGKTGAGLGAGFATREAAWELVKAGVARWSGSEAEGRLELVVKAEATRDLAVAEYGLLAGMGMLTGRNLELPVAYYDPQDNYGEVRNKWIGFGTAGDE